MRKLVINFYTYRVFYIIRSNMQYTIKIMLPAVASSLKLTSFRGYIDISDSDHVICIYITKYTNNNDFLLKTNKTGKSLEEDKVIYGYCNGHSGRKSKMNRCFPNFLVLEQEKNIHIKQLVINSNNIELTNKSIIMLYDYDSILHSETISDNADYFTKLQKKIHMEYNISQKGIKDEPIYECPYWLKSSMFVQHIFNYTNIIYWLIHTTRRKKKISIKQGNLILAILTDIILGYILQGLFTQDKKVVSSTLMGILEKLVNSLYTLLKWLMGAPAGLKLNNAFNKMLGKYFSYHIQLWWLFLDVSGEKLDIILHIFHYLGYLGFTFQAAIISDMLCVATFHSYCIYVYAARLFNIQISGLIALLRLFVGRKYNPLRGGIDSCEYTNQELFVGTVAFTVLLLLLPTTAMYYVVFTMFRLLSIMLQYILAKLIYLVQTLPLYVVSLWLVQSPKVAGNILIEAVDNDETSPLTLRVKLFSKSVQYLVNSMKPPVKVPKQIEWKSILSNILVGKQII